MALPSGFELLFIVVVLGLLFILSRKGLQSRVDMNILFLLVIGVLIFALFSLTRLVLTLFSVSLLLVMTMVLVMAVLFFRLIRR